MSQSTYLFSKKKETDVKLGYYLYLPEGYNTESKEKWPLLVFLHGAGERGNGESELARVKKHGIPKILDGGKNLPFIALSPQCPENSTWVAQIENLNFLVDEIIKEYTVDESRLYLTGMSMGGYGTWFYSMAYPDKFAAIAPVCGGGLAWNADVLKNVPVWVFHGEVDSVVPFAESVDMVNALKKIGGKVKFTSYPGVDHDSWTETYNNDELYKWFLQQSK
jgi:predicted peptidase